ncbi:DNA-binding PadR family transcriptional regulator [Microcella putealis]|uniref:DNA-binding PadR family transcriptional regulator n=1 Tax=Microcella putealis TaxID=337005 RepID=A0A4Q7LW41_9MICO|nr:PadR family transcriptional regulator [Microcella putealis]RZS59226.1 DNA-binding PadR family transcriptional regulator [Microcella putealis]TQM24252.1 DNA-binding PadR family transcriptional regulator [Microcella putealis]
MGDDDLRAVSEATATHRQEVRRGSVVIASLLALREPDYGYALLERLGTAAIDVDANTLYPLLRRLESQGLLTSEWNTDDVRPRKFYRTTAAGDALARELLDDHQRITDALGRLAEGGPA